MGGPGRVCSRLDCGEERRGGAAGVAGFEGVGLGVLNEEGERGGGAPGAVDGHAGDLGGDGVVGYAVGDAGGPGGVVAGGEEVQEGVVDLVEVGAVLPGVEEAAVGDLGELAGAVETARSRGEEGVDGGGERFPVGWGGGLILVGGEGRGVPEEGLVGGAVPGLGFDGEAVAVVGRAFVMTVDLLFSVRGPTSFLRGWPGLTTST